MTAPPPQPHYPSGEDIQAPPGNSLTFLHPTICSVTGSTWRPLLTRGGELPSPWVRSLPLAQPLTCPPPEAALCWRGPHPPQRLLWAGRQLLTSPGPSMMSSAGLSLGRPSWTARPLPTPRPSVGGALIIPTGEAALSPSSPPRTPDSPQGFRGLTNTQCTICPQFSLYIAMLWGSSHSPTLKGLHVPSAAPRASWEGLFSLLWVVPSFCLPLPPILAHQFIPTQPLAPTNTEGTRGAVPHLPRPSASFQRHAYSCSRGPPSLQGLPVPRALSRL